jgi:hypothetical protein
VRLRDLDRAELAPTLTAAETAELLGCHVESLRELCRRGCSPVEPLRLGRALRFPTARVLEVLGIEPRDDAPGAHSRGVGQILPAGQEGTNGDASSEAHNTTPRTD